MNRMAKSQRLIVLVLLLVLLFVYLSMKSYDPFIGTATVPDACGTAGIRPSDATFSFMKAMLGKDAFSSMRRYTKSECNKLKDGVYANMNCYQLKNKPDTDSPIDLSSSNIILDYGQTCAGLNQSTAVMAAPSECMIDGTHAGKPNIAFSTTFGLGNPDTRSTITVEDNAVRLYTENECKLLKGRFALLTDALNKIGATKDEQTKAEHLNGKDVGFCSGDLDYSTICTINAASSPAAQVSTASKKAITSWLNS